MLGYMVAFFALCVHTVRSPIACCFAIDASALVAVSAPVDSVLVVVSASTHSALCCGVRRWVGSASVCSLSLGLDFFLAFAFGGMDIATFAAYCLFAMLAYRVFDYAGVATGLSAFTAFCWVVSVGIASTRVVAFVYAVDVVLVDVAAYVVPKRVVVVGLVCYGSGFVTS